MVLHLVLVDFADLAVLLEGASMRPGGPAYCREQSLGWKAPQRDCQTSCEIESEELEASQAQCPFSWVDA